MTKGDSFRFRTSLRTPSSRSAQGMKSTDPAATWSSCCIRSRNLAFDAAWRPQPVWWTTITCRHPFNLGDQKRPDEVVGHPSAGVPIIPDVGGARRDELSRLQPRVDTAKDGDRPMLPFGSHGVLGHSIGPAGYQRLVSMSGIPQQLVLKIRTSHIGMEFWHTVI